MFTLKTEKCSYTRTSRWMNSWVVNIVADTHKTHCLLFASAKCSAQRIIPNPSKAINNKNIVIFKHKFMNLTFLQEKRQSSDKHDGISKEQNRDAKCLHLMVHILDDATVCFINDTFMSALKNNYGARMEHSDSRYQLRRKLHDCTVNISSALFRRSSVWVIP